MNTRRICLIALVVLFGLALLTGCIDLTKTSIDAETFKTRMEGLGYSIVDATNQFDSSLVNKVYIALDSTRSYQIEFYEQYSNEAAQGSFITNKTKMENAKTSSSMSTSLTGQNYERVTQDSGGEYWVVSRIDNTFIFVNTNSANKDAVNNALESLGY